MKCKDCGSTNCELGANKKDLFYLTAQIGGFISVLMANLFGVLLGILASGNIKPPVLWLMLFSLAVLSLWQAYIRYEMAQEK